MVRVRIARRRPGNQEGAVARLRDTRSSPLLQSLPTHATICAKEAPSCAEEAPSSQQIVEDGRKAAVQMKQQEMHIFRRLELFTPEVIEAWFQLFKTGKPEHFATLMQAVQPQRP